MEKDFEWSFRWLVGGAIVITMGGRFLVKEWHRQCVKICPFAGKVAKQLGAGVKKDYECFY